MWILQIHDCDFYQTGSPFGYRELSRRQERFVEAAEPRRAVSRDQCPTVESQHGMVRLETLHQADVQPCESLKLGDAPMPTTLEGTQGLRYGAVASDLIREDAGVFDRECATLSRGRRHDVRSVPD